MLHSSSPTLRHGYRIVDHELTVPLAHPHLPRPASLAEAHARAGFDSATISVFAREISAPGGENRPPLLYLQGGPGCPSPRPTFGVSLTNPTGSLGGFVGELTKHYRVFLLDQRGTGRSTPVDIHHPAALDPTLADAAPASPTSGPDVDILAAYLSCFRADSIVADAEALRTALCDSGQLSDPTWALLGQSYGGFCSLSYLSAHPDSLAEVLITGGLPGFPDAPDTPIDEVYRHTYAATVHRNTAFADRFPEAAATLRRVCAHLDSTEEFLPTGERLTSRRLRMIGMDLGRTGGFAALATLLESPFLPDRGLHAAGERLSSTFLDSVAASLSFRSTPLYAIMHESIYCFGSASNWAAARLAEELPGFGTSASSLADADPASPVYLTGEHIYPWLFEEDPSLRPWAAVADRLARVDDWGPLYDAEALRDTPVPVAAQVYVDDMFVPFEHSLATARLLGAATSITNLLEHNGLAVDPGTIIPTLRALNRA